LRFEVLTAVTKKAAMVTVSMFSKNFVSSKAHTYFSSFIRCQTHFNWYFSNPQGHKI